MAANTTPIYTLTPKVFFANTDGDGGAAGPLKTANTAKDGTGTVLSLPAFDATNGGYADHVRFRPAGTNVATVARVFLNNGSTQATLGNNILIVNDNFNNGSSILRGTASSLITATNSLFMELENGAEGLAPLKHTVTVKPGEKISVLVTADARGDWAFHCHLFYHMEAGMFRVFNVA